MGPTAVGQPTSKQSSAVSVSTPRLLALHLLPGALIALAYSLVALILARSGGPPNLALLLAFLLVGIPFEYGYLRYVASRSNPPTLAAVIGFRERLPARQTVLFVTPLFVWSVVSYTLLAPVAEWLRQVAFAWWPGSLSLAELGTHLARYDRTVLWAVAILSLALNVAGPLVEELYFRGYLLARMGQLGRWAPLINMVLFSLYHFWLPWEFFSRLIALLPAVYVAWWKRDLAISIWVHVLLNSVGSIGLLVLVLTR